jgi:hypothetical protein
MKYKNVGNHAIDLADGRMSGVGEMIDLDEDQVREGINEDYLATGMLLGIDESAEHEARLADRRVSQRDKKQQLAAEAGAEDKEEA